MANRMSEAMKSNWKPILWGLIPFLVIVIIFALPMKKVPIQVTETYWDTEMKSEPYTVSESYTVTEPYIASETKTETVYDNYVWTSNWSYTFDVARPNSTVTISYAGNYVYPQYYYWTTDNRTRFFPWRYLNDFSGAKAIIQVTYPQEVTKYRTVTKNRDVVQYRQVPTQVLKERKVTQYVIMSLWAYLFFEQPK